MSVTQNELSSLLEVAEAVQATAYRSWFAVLKAYDVDSDPDRPWGDVLDWAFKCGYPRAELMHDLKLDHTTFGRWVRNEHFPARHTRRGLLVQIVALVEKRLEAG